MYTRPQILNGDFKMYCLLMRELDQPITDAEVQGFKKMLNELQLIPLKSQECYFTWSNKQQGTNRVYSKIVWVFGNFICLQ